MSKYPHLCFMFRAAGTGSTQWFDGKDQEGSTFSYKYTIIPPNFNKRKRKRNGKARNQRMLWLLHRTRQCLFRDPHCLLTSVSFNVIGKDFGRWKHGHCIYIYISHLRNCLLTSFHIKPSTTAMVVAATSVSEINRTLEGLTHLLPYRQVMPATPVGTLVVTETEVKLV